MENFKKAWQWLVKSSANANEISLTVKSFLYGLIPGILFLTNITHIQVQSEYLTQIFDGIVQLIVCAGGAIAAVGFIWGAVRKIVTTITGRNNVVASWGNEERY